MNSPFAVTTQSNLSIQDESYSSDEAQQPTVVRSEIVHSGGEPETQDPNAAAAKLAEDLRNFETIVGKFRAELQPQETFEDRCQQAFAICNDLFGHAPTWVCFFRETIATNGMVRQLFANDSEFGEFTLTEPYSHILQMMTALRSRDLPENDPNDRQRMITVRLPKSLHEALCDEAGRMKISVNKLCISRMLQLLDPMMVPETNTKPRGRKPRARTPVPTT